MAACQPSCGACFRVERRTQRAAQMAAAKQQQKGITVKDVSADKFIAAYAELLKRSGKVCRLPMRC